MVVRPLAGRAVVGAARRQRGGVPGLDLLLAGRGEGDVQPRRDRPSRLDAEVLAARRAEGDVVVDRDLAIAERRERGAVERARPLEIGDGDRQVVDRDAADEIAHERATFRRSHGAAGNAPRA